MSFSFVVSDARPSPVDPNKVFLPEPPHHELRIIPNIEKPTSSCEVYDYSHPERKFTENQGQLCDENEYERSGGDPGLVVIFNHHTFDDTNFTIRSGTNRDVNELILTFGRLGYNVEKENVHNNLSRQEILDVLDKLSKQNHSDRNSLIIAVLTHGDENNMLQARDKHIYTYEIWDPFSESTCSTLRNKPKFFIFQACKGQKYSQTDSAQSEMVPNIVYQKPMEPNMLIAFSAVEGNRSYRHISNGSWFIQELCKNFQAYGRRDDVVSLLIRTTKCVTYNYYHNEPNQVEEASVKKQMPLLVSTLTRKFYMTKSKDRNLILQIMQQQKDMVDALTKVPKCSKNEEERKMQRMRK